MDETRTDTGRPARPSAGYIIAAGAVALAGLADAAYLTAKHYSGRNVPCSLITGCEQVLTSEYAEMFGVPTAAYGALAYFVVFSLAVLTYYGSARTWDLLGVLVGLMALFTGWLVYLQAFVIGAFCQFCLISAATTLALLSIYLLSRFTRRG